VAYDKAVDYISGKNQKQLLMFISGEGGTGKSFIIALIMEYTKLLYGKQKGLYGSAVALAPTGCAANVIKGYTWQSAYGKGKYSDRSDDTTISQDMARKVGEKFRGTRLIVIDEVSMINLESIAEMSYRHQQALLSITDDEAEREIIKSLPFGGVHIIFTGDLWQLKAIGGASIYTNKTLYGRAISGREIWHKINEYCPLKENYRFKNDTTSILKDFLRGAREGKVDEDLLHQVNKRLVLSQTEAKKIAHPIAAWVSHNKDSVRAMNDADFRDKVASGATHFRIVATHTSATDNHPSPGEEERLILYQTTKKKGGTPTHVDLAIGSRVSCTKNLGTQIGKPHSETT
jgi:hypothetical protein